jgi:hypothetical protein
VITVGLGSPENARIFSSTLDFPLDDLYADPTGACYSALGFSPGFAPGADINPYLKLLPMLAGIGSPGTLQEVSGVVESPVTWLCLTVQVKRCMVGCVYCRWQQVVQRQLG